LKQLLCLIVLICSLTITSCSPQVTYTGDTEAGLPHGQGRQDYPGGAFYEGEFCQGELSGYGTWQHPNGTCYEGFWQNSLYHGYGTLTIPGHYTYEGSWKNGHKESYGIQAWEDGRRYEGQWLNNRQHGRGTLYHPDGSRYEGQWIEGRRHGPGTMYHADGEIQTGMWNKGKFIYIPVEAVILTETEITLTSEDEPYLLQAITAPFDATKPQLDWVSGNPDVATVDAGLITPRAPGEAVIKAAATADGFQAECLVTVIKPPVPITAMRLNRSWLNFYPNSEPFRLETIIEPDSASDAFITWSSSAPEIASVTSAGLVTPLKPGQAEITARIAAADITDSCIVNVRPPANQNNIFD